MNFGEILEPSSRAFWNDFDEEQDGPHDHTNFLSKVNWHWLTDDKLQPHHTKIPLLIVIEGTGMSDFMKSAVLKGAKPFGQSQNGNVIIYHIPNENQIICFSEENDLNFSGIITEFLKSIIIKADNVITFSLQSKVQYKGDDENVNNEITFLRGINSKHHYVKELTAPNFITGISAGVSSLRYIENLPIASYIGYTDPLIELDGISVQPIITLFKDIGIKCDNKYISKNRDPSLLYM